MASNIDNCTNVLVRIPDDLLEAIDKLANKNSLSRTSQMIIILRDYFKQGDALDAMSKFIRIYEKETKQELGTRSKKRR